MSLAISSFCEGVGGSTRGIDAMSSYLPSCSVAATYTVHLSFHLLNQLAMLELSISSSDRLSLG